MFVPRTERQAWLGVFVCLGLTYGTIFVGRNIQLLLSATQLILPLFYTALALVGLWLFFLARRKALSRKAWGGLLCVLIFGAIILRFFTGCPEELLHLIYYGSLGHYCYLALRFSHSSKTSLLLALLFTGLCGWGDEIIQYFTPGRYFGWRDVWLNGLSGLFGILLTRIFTPKRP